MCPYHALFVFKEGFFTLGKRKDTNGRVLKTGESQRKDGSYMFRKMYKGQTICIYASSLNELRHKEDEINEDIYLGINIWQKAEPLKWWIERMLSLKYNIKETTKELYDGYFRVLCRYSFLDTKIDEITESKLKMFYIQLKKDGYKQGTIKNYHDNIIRPSLKLAVRDDVIRKNPADFSMKEIFLPEKPVKFALTDEQCRILLEYMMSDKYYRKHYDLVVVLLETGMRISELCGLTKTDIDFKNNRVSINKQLVRVNGRYAVISPKSNAGTRFIPMTNKCRNALMRVINNRHCKIETIIDGHTGFLFLTKKDHVYINSTVRWYLNTLVKSYNSKNTIQLPHITPHTFRHTFCTRLINKGVDFKSIQYLMGHSSIDVSLNVYGHATYETVKVAFEKLM